LQGEWKAAKGGRPDRAGERIVAAAAGWNPRRPWLTVLLLVRLCRTADVRRPLVRLGRRPKTRSATSSTEIGAAARSSPDRGRVETYRPGPTAAADGHRRAEAGSYGSAARRPAAGTAACLRPGARGTNPSARDSGNHARSALRRPSSGHTCHTSLLTATAAGLRRPGAPAATGAGADGGAQARSAASRGAGSTAPAPIRTAPRRVDRSRLTLGFRRRRGRTLDRAARLGGSPRSLRAHAGS